MTTYIDSNFGTYDIRDPEDVDFYHDVQRRSVTKICEGCHQKVRILPDYAYCDSCATKREKGWDC